MCAVRDRDRPPQLRPAPWCGGSARIAALEAGRPHRAQPGAPRRQHKERKGPRAHPPIRGPLSILPASVDRCYAARGSALRESSCQRRGWPLLHERLCASFEKCVCGANSALRRHAGLPDACRNAAPLPAAGAVAALPVVPRLRSLVLREGSIDTWAPTLHHPAARGGRRRGRRRELRQARADAGQRRQVGAVPAAAGTARLCRGGGRKQCQLRAVGGHLLLQRRHLALQLRDSLQVSGPRLPAQGNETVGRDAAVIMGNGGSGMVQGSTTAVTSAAVPHLPMRSCSCAARSSSALFSSSSSFTCRV